MVTSRCHALCRDQTFGFLTRDISLDTPRNPCKLAHLGLSMIPRCSTLSDANVRRPECVVEKIFHDLYANYRDKLSSDNRKHQTPKWLNRLKILDSTTITLFFNLIFKGVVMPMRVFSLTYSIYCCSDERQFHAQTLTICSGRYPCHRPCVH